MNLFLDAATRAVPNFASRKVPLKKNPTPLRSWPPPTQDPLESRGRGTNPVPPAVVRHLGNPSAARPIMLVAQLVSMLPGTIQDLESCHSGLGEM